MVCSQGRLPSLWEVQAQQGVQRVEVSTFKLGILMMIAGFLLALSEMLEKKEVTNG